MSTSIEVFSSKDANVQVSCAWVACGYPLGNLEVRGSNIQGREEFPPFSQPFKLRTVLWFMET